MTSIKCPIGKKDKKVCLVCKFSKEMLCDFPHSIKVPAEVKR